MAERWSDPASERSTPRPIPRSSLRPSQRYEEPARRGSDSLEQGIDRLVSAGRQLVDGVSGARPGSRKPGRGAAAGPGMRPRLGELGRWVEDKLDWILEDDDDWREPWQPTRESARPLPREGEPEPARQVSAPASQQPDGSFSSSRRRPLEAISRRAPVLQGASGPDQDWPDDDSFSRPRWQRSVAQPAQPAQQSLVPRGAAGDRPAPDGSALAARPVPRSSRRRQPD
jgi:hypothetical protein